MKNLLKVVLLVGLFVSCLSTEGFSQKIYNNTDCGFLVKVEFTYPSTSPFCGDAGAATIPVLANSIVSMNLPSIGNIVASVTASTGYPRVAGGSLGTAPPSCGIYSIGVTPCPGMVTDTQNCSSGPCTTYTATLNPATSDITIN